jgi:hypothetical protein
MQALRASASYSLVLSLNQSTLITPEMAQSLSEELEEDDDA